MSLLRNDQQVALNDLLVESEKSADHYRDSADFLGSLPPSLELNRIAGEREQLSQELSEAVRASGDFPSVPDEDLESVEKLFHRVHASLSHDEMRDVLQLRLDAEEEFARQIEDARQHGLTAGHETLIGELQQHVQSSIARLRGMLQDFVSPR